MIVSSKVEIEVGIYLERQCARAERDKVSRGRSLGQEFLPELRISRSDFDRIAVSSQGEAKERRAQLHVRSFRKRE